MSTSPDGTLEILKTAMVSAPVEPTTPAPTLEILEEQKHALSRSVTPSLYTDPDEMARYQRLSAATGLDPSLLSTDKEVLKQAEAEQRAIDLDFLVKNNPLTSKFLSIPGNADVASDDVPALAAIEDVSRRVGVVEGTARALFSGPTTMQAGIAGAIEGVSAYGRSVAGDGAIGSFFGSIQEGARQEAVRSSNRADTIVGDTRDLGPTSSAIVSGAKSFSSLAATLAGGLGTKGTLAVLSTATGGQTASEALSKGATPEAALAAGVIDGLIEAVTEFGPTKIASSLLASKTIKENMAKKFGEYLLADVGGEQLATFLQDANAQYLIPNNKTWADYWKERPTAAYQTLVSTLATGGAVYGVSRTIKELDDRYGEGAKERAVLDGLLNGVEKSKLAKRLPAKMREYIGNVRAESGGSPNVYIEASKFAEYFDSVGIPPSTAAVELLGTGNNLEEALASGGDLVIPIENYVTTIAGTEHRYPLMEKIRFSQDSLSREEYAQAVKEAEIHETLFKSEVAAQQEEFKQNAPAQKVYEEFYAEQIAAGEEATAAEARATLLAARYATRAKALEGETAYTLWKRDTPITIRREVPGSLATSPAETLDALRNYRPPTETPSDTAMSAPTLGPGDAGLAGVDSPNIAGATPPATATATPPATATAEATTATPPTAEATTATPPTAEATTNVLPSDLQEVKDYLDSMGVDLTTMDNDQVIARLGLTVAMEEAASPVSAPDNILGAIEDESNKRDDNSDLVYVLGKIIEEEEELPQSARVRQQIISQSKRAGESQNTKSDEAFLEVAPAFIDEFDRRAGDSNTPLSVVAQAYIDSIGSRIPQMSAEKIVAAIDRMPGQVQEAVAAGRLNALVQTTTDLRGKSLADVSRFFVENSSLYAPVEAASILSVLSRSFMAYNARSGKVEKSDFGPTSFTPISTTTPAIISEAVEGIRSGVPASKAFAAALLSWATSESKYPATGWHKFLRSSSKEDIEELSKAASTSPGNWCTGQALTYAEDQLTRGDFYIYFRDRKAAIAIRMEGNSVAEVRGSLPGQNLAPEDGAILETFGRNSPGLKGLNDVLTDAAKLRLIAESLQTGVAAPALFSIRIEEGYVSSTLDFDRANKGYVATPLASPDEQEKILAMPKPGVQEAKSMGALEVYNSSHELPNLEKVYGSVRAAPENIPNIRTVMGGLTVTKVGSVGVVHVGRSLTYAHGSVFPNLVRAGDIPYMENGEFPVLETIDGGILRNWPPLPELTSSGSVTDSTESLPLPKLHTIRGALKVDGEVEKLFPSLRVVEGDFTSLSTGEKLSHETLEVIGGALSFEQKSAYFPALRSLSASDVYSTVDLGRVDAPNLEEIGNTKISETTKIPKLRKANTIYFRGPVTLPQLETASMVVVTEGVVDLPNLQKIDFVSVEAGAELISTAEVNTLKCYGKAVGISSTKILEMSSKSEISPTITAVTTLKYDSLGASGAADNIEKVGVLQGIGAALAIFPRLSEAHTINVTYPVSLPALTRVDELRVLNSLSAPLLEEASEVFVKYSIEENDLRKLRRVTDLNATELPYGHSAIFPGLEVIEGTYIGTYGSGSADPRVSMPNLRTVENITEFIEGDFPHLFHVGTFSAGIGSEEGFKAPNLKKVKNLTVYDYDFAPVSITEVEETMIMETGTLASSVEKVHRGHLRSDSRAPNLAEADYLDVEPDVQAPLLRTVSKNLETWSELPSLETVGGNLTSFASLDVVDVGGSADLHGDSQLPNVESIGGDLTYGNLPRKFPKLKFIGGRILRAEKGTFPALEHVGTYDYPDVEADFPALLSAGTFSIGPKGSAPLLKSIYNDADIGTTLPSLVNVEGAAYIQKGVSVPNLVRVAKTVHLEEGASAPNLKEAARLFVRSLDQVPPGLQHLIGTDSVVISRTLLQSARTRLVEIGQRDKGDNVERALLESIPDFVDEVDRQNGHSKESLESIAEKYLENKQAPVTDLIAVRDAIDKASYEIKEAELLGYLPDVVKHANTARKKELDAIKKLPESAVIRAALLSVLSRTSMRYDAAKGAIVQSSFSPTSFRLTTPMPKSVLDGAIQGMRNGKSAKAAIADALTNWVMSSGHKDGWVKHPQSTSQKDAQELLRDAATSPGGWCTGTAISTAKEHLSKGDFYIYFANSSAKIAIRMEHKRVGEIRGSGPAQALQPGDLQLVSEAPVKFPEMGSIDNSIEEIRVNQEYRDMVKEALTTGEVPPGLYTYIKGSSSLQAFVHLDWLSLGVPRAARDSIMQRIVDIPARPESLYKTNSVAALVMLPGAPPLPHVLRATLVDMKEGTSLPNLETVQKLVVQGTTAPPKVTRVKSLELVNASSGNITEVGELRADVKSDVSSIRKITHGFTTTLDQFPNLEEVKSSGLRVEKTFPPNLKEMEGSLWVAEGVVLPDLDYSKIILDNTNADLSMIRNIRGITVTKINNPENLEEVEILRIEDDVELPRLRKVSHITAHGYVNTPPLGEVTNLTIYGVGATVSSITRVTEHATIVETTLRNTTQIEKMICRNSAFPDLKKIGTGDVTSCKLPALEQAKSLVSVETDLPALQKAGTLRLIESNAPALRSVGTLWIGPGCVVGDVIAKVVYAESMSDVPPHLHEKTILVKRVVSAGSPERVLAQSATTPRATVTLRAGLREISLLGGADLSSILHELGHTWLEEMQRDAESPNASPQLVADWKTLRDALKIPEGGIISTDSHEQFASWTERYFFDGTSPSVMLREIFYKFRQWMMSVYKVASELGPIPDDVREVFDRLLASDAELKLAKESARPMFSTPEEAGMTPAEWAAYGELVKKDLALAEDAMHQRVVEEMKREDARWWRTEERAVRKAVTRDVRSRRVYKAIREMSTGKDVEGNVLPIPLKLRKETILSIYGVDMLRKLSPTSLRTYGWIVSESGDDPEILAPIFGFSSGDEMIQEIINATPEAKKIEEEVSRQMKEKFGDPMDPARLAEAAYDSVANDLHANLLQTELRILRRKKKEIAPVIKAIEKEKAAERRRAVAMLDAPIPDATLKMLAAQEISQQRIQDIRPLQYKVAGDRAGRAALSAAAKGDFEKAVDEKQRQLVNMYMYRAATKAKKDVDAAVRYMGKMSKRRASIGRAGQEWLDQLDSILGRYSFAPASTTQLAQDIAQFATMVKEETGEDLAVSPALLRESVRKNYRDVSLDEFMGVVDTVKSIERVSKNINKVVLAGQEYEMDEIVAELAEAAKANITNVSPMPETDVISAWDTVMKQGGDFVRSLLRPEKIFERLDGGKQGIWHRVFWDRFAAAEARKNDLLRETTADISAFQDTRGKEWDKRLGERVHIPSIGESLERRTLIGIALNLGNEGNRKKFQRGGMWFGERHTGAISDAQLADLVAPLNAEEWEFVQMLWDSIDKLYEPLNELNKKAIGLPLGRVERTPVQTKYGTLAGGYWPAVADPRHSVVGEIQENALASQIFSSPFPSAATPHSFREARTGAVYPIQLDWASVLSRHLDRATTDIAYHTVAKETSAILKKNAVRKVLQNRLGNDVFRGLEEWIVHQVNPLTEKAVANSAVGAITGRLQTNVAIMALGYKVPLAMANAITAPIQSFHQLNPVYWVQGVLKVMSDPQGALEAMRAMSGEMRYHTDNMNVAVNEAINKAKGKHGWHPWLTKNSMAIHQYVERWTSATIWWGKFIQESRTLSPDEAIKLADKTVRTTQMSSAPKDLSAFERSKSLKVYSQFLGPMLVLQNEIRGEIAKSSGGTGIKAKSLSNPKVYVTALTTLILPSIVFELASGRGPDDDEEWWRWAMWRILLEPFRMIPLVRDAVSPVEFAIRGKGWSSPNAGPVANMISGVARSAKQFLTDDDMDAGDMVAALSGPAGTIFGLPTAQPGVAMQFGADIISGRYEPESVTDLRYLILRRDRKED